MPEDTHARRRSARLHPFVYERACHADIFAAMARHYAATFNRLICALVDLRAAAERVCVERDAAEL